jgi:hypothetical protein
MAAMIEGAGTSLKAALDILPPAQTRAYFTTSMYLGDDDTFFAAAATRL